MDLKEHLSIFNHFLIIYVERVKNGSFLKPTVLRFEPRLMKCSNAAGNNFMQVWTNLCNRKCSYTTGNNFMRVWTNLCDRESFSVTNCWQELHFEFSRQNLNQNVQSPPMLWWLIKQSRPIWKKAPPGLQRPSHTESGISGDLYWPDPSVPHPGPDLEGLWGQAHTCKLIIK